MIQAKTLMVDHRANLARLEKLIDEQLSQHNLKFTIYAHNVGIIPPVFLQFFIQRYVSEGGFLHAQAEFKPAMDQRDEPGYYQFIFTLPPDEKVGA